MLTISAIPAFNFVSCEMQKDAVNAARVGALKQTKH